MTNAGLLSGLTPGTWKRYKPKIICVGGTNPTLDDFGDVRTNVGKYLHLPNGRVFAQIQLDFGGAATIGSGGPYAFSLPFPAWRPTLPIPLGYGMCYLNFNPGTDPNPQMDVVPTLADPNSALDDPDYWFQAYASHVLDWGSGTWAIGTASKVVNHNVGYAFSPEEIDISWQNSAGNAWWPEIVTTITPTQFTIASRGPNVGGNLNFEYVIKARPPAGAQGALIAPNVPYAWSRFTNLGPFGHFFFGLNYRPRR